MQRDRGSQGVGPEAARPEVDPNVPQSARVYDFLLGGKDNFGADRAVGAALIENVPALPLMVRAQRAFLARAVRYLVADAGIRQFLDIVLLAGDLDRLGHLLVGIPQGVVDQRISPSPSARASYRRIRR